MLLARLLLLICIFLCSFYEVDLQKYFDIYQIFLYETIFITLTASKTHK